MPYKHAIHFVALTLAVIVVGFWGSYFRPIAEVPLAFHVHASTALVWVSLLMVQLWAIHSGRRDLHRRVGMASLFLFPFLIVGFVMIINVSAAGFAVGDDPVARFLGPSVGIGMAIAIVAYLIVYYRALRLRRNVHLHAGYMLATPLILFESPFSRVLLIHLPFLVFTDSGFPQRIIDAIVISMGLSIVFALLVWLGDRRTRTPFLVTAGLMTAQAAAMYLATDSAWVRSAFGIYARIPAELSIAAGFAAGAAVSWLGWRSPGGGLSSVRATAAT